MTNLKKQGTIAFLWDFLGKFLIQSTTFIVTIFLARLLEPSDFGIIAIVMVIIGISSIFTDLGLGSAIVQRRKLLDIHYSSVFYLNVLLGTVLSIFTYLSAESISNFFNEIRLLEIIQILSILFIPNSLNSLQLIILKKELNFKKITKITFFASLLSGLLGIILALNGYGVYSLVYQQLSLSIVTLVLLWIHSDWYPRLIFSIRALVQLWSFGFKLFLSGLIDNIFMRLDYIIIGKLIDTITLGYFQRAKQFNSLIITYSSGSLMSILFPLLSKIQKDLTRFQNVILKGYSLLAFVVFLLLGIMYLTSYELIIILFGDKWLKSVDYFELLVLSSFSYPLSSLLVNVLSSRGNSKDFLRLEIIKKIALALNFYIGFKFGLEGFLYGLVLVAIWSISWNIYFVKKEIELSAYVFIKPVFVQALLIVITVFLTTYLESFFELSNWGYLIFEILFCIFSFVVLNLIFQTESIKNIKEELIPLLKIKGKKNHVS